MDSAKEWTMAGTVRPLLPSSPTRLTTPPLSQPHPAICPASAAVTAGHASSRWRPQKPFPTPHVLVGSTGRLDGHHQHGLRLLERTAHESCHVHRDPLPSPCRSHHYGRWLQRSQGFLRLSLDLVGVETERLGCPAWVTSRDFHASGVKISRVDPAGFNARTSSRPAACRPGQR